MRVTYRYPSWTGMKPTTEDPGGDLRAVEGTVAEVTIELDRPLTSGVVALDEDKRIPLSGDGKILKADVPDPEGRHVSLRCAGSWTGSPAERRLLHRSAQGQSSSR